MLNFIRKFGLEHCDLSTMMWNLSFLLRVLSLDIDNKGIPVAFYVLTIVSAGCYFYIYVLSMVWFVFWRCIETGDVLPAMLVFSLGTAGSIGPVKLIYTLIYRKSVRKIASATLACDALVIPGSRFSKNLQKTLRNVKTRAIVFWVIMMGNGLIYLARPFFMPGRHLMEDIFIYYGLEPMYETPNYEISLITTIIGVMFACYAVVNVTAFVIINTGYVEAQMFAWSEELLHLWDDFEHFYNETRIRTIRDEVQPNSSSDYKTALNKFVGLRLTDVIQGHARNLDLLHQIEDVFRGAFVIEFLILIVGLIAELLGGLEKTYIEIPFSFIPVVVDCVTGQRLIDTSKAFERVVYECRWEDFDRRNMKLVLVMLQNSQKTMTLSAGGLTVLNFSWLMTVVRSVYSAYTALRSTLHK